MPELPEVETIARDLNDTVRGATVATVRVFRPDVLREITPRSLAARCRGVVLERFWRRAKYVVADLSSGDRLVVSPRFTGALLIEPGLWNAGAGDYTTIAFALADGRTMRYRDVRRLGTVTLMKPARFKAWEATLGPEPLDAAYTDRAFTVAMRGSGRAIKTTLMDQRKVAGVGNIYANEALWRARIRPTRRGAMLTHAECRRLFKEVRAVLTTAVEQRGTSFRDYQDPFGGRGGFLELAKVYGRAGKPCVRCKTPLRSSHALENRITVWCSSCQR